MTPNGLPDDLRWMAASFALNVSKAAEAVKDAARDPIDWLAEETAWELYEASALRCIALQRKGHRSALTLLPPDASTIAALRKFAEMAIEMRREKPQAADAVDPSAASTGTPSTRDKESS